MQVKSRADQTVFNGCIAAFEESPLSQRFFFVCHSPKGSLAVPMSSRPVHLWDLNGLAGMSVANGMTDWLIERAA